MLELKNIHLTFNKGTATEKRALCGVDLTLKDGDFVTVIGGNGAGKSTMLNVIAGVFPVDDGKIILDGKDVTGLREFKRAAYMSRVFQDPLSGTAANMNIEENLALASRRGKKRGLKWGMSKTELEEYKRLLAGLELGLEKRTGQKVGTLSGGQRQALTLLMASLASPKLLLLDEHTAALDPKTAKKVLSLTDEIISKEKLTAIMITHNMNDAIAHGNRLVMMNAGRVIYDVEGEEKKRLTISDLLDKFEKITGEEIASDKMILGS